MKMIEKVVKGVFFGVVKVFGFFISLVVNSVVGKKLFGFFFGEMVFVIFDGFSKRDLLYYYFCINFEIEFCFCFVCVCVIDKVCDVVEVVGKNVMKIILIVIIEIVDYK